MVLTIVQMEVMNMAARYYQVNATKMSFNANHNLPLILVKNQNAYPGVIDAMVLEIVPKEVMKVGCCATIVQKIA